MHKDKVYGIKFNPTKENGGVVRTFDAKGLSYRQQTGEDVGLSDFDKCYPWSEIKECMICSDGAVIYAASKDFSRNGNVFMEIPCFYFKRTVIGDEEEWLICGEPKDGFEIEPWFVNEDGSIAKCRYIAKYEGCDWKNGQVSVSGQTPCRQHTIDEFRDGCEQAGFQLCSVYAYLAIQHLFVVECGTLKSQALNSGGSYFPYSSHNYCLAAETSFSNTATVPYNPRWEMVDIGATVYFSEQISGDITNARILTAIEREGDFLHLTLDGAPIHFLAEQTRVFPSAQPTGLCDGMQYVNGRPSANEYTSSFLYRGIENIYGNMWECMDGTGYANSNPYISIFGNPLSYETPVNHTYGQSGKGFIAKLGYDPTKPWATFPCLLGGTKDSHYHDEWSTFGNEDSIVVFGGGWDHFYCNGIFCMRTVGKESTNWLYGYRAMKL